MADTIVTITRANTSELYRPLVVNLAVSGTATFNTDYTVLGASSFTATTASVTIPANETFKTITLSSVADTVIELDETVILTIVPTAGVSSGNGSVTWNILNDEIFNVVLLMPMTTASGITDIKGKSTTNAGVSISTAILDPFGQNAGVVSFPGGGSRIEVAQSADFAFSDSAMAIEWWLYPTAFPASGGGVWGLLDARPAVRNTDWTISANSTGNPTFYDVSQVDTATGSFILNQWNYLCVSRSAVVSEPHKIWINGNLVLTASNRNNEITAYGNLIVGDILNTLAPDDQSFIGYGSNLRIIRNYKDGSIVPVAPFTV
jgi:hypothetical protein